MKTLRVKAKNGKTTPIFLLTNWDLIFCVPIFILNIFNLYIFYPLILRFVNLVGYPAIKLIGDVANVSKAKTWFVTTLYMLMLPAAWAGFAMLSRPVKRIASATRALSGR